MPYRLAIALFSILFIAKQGYKDSNLEMLESESSALPFGDSPIFVTFTGDSRYYIEYNSKLQVLF